MTTKIELCGETWNPVVGCSPVSPGCKNCYAYTTTASLEMKGIPEYRSLCTGVHFTGTVRPLPERLDIPSRWRKPRRVSVNSMSDLFHPGVSDRFILDVYAVMANLPRHTFVVLTKRAPRMAAWWAKNADVRVAVQELAFDDGAFNDATNIWTGVSVENENAAKQRIVELQHVPRNRLVCIEPLLAPIHLTESQLGRADWIIIGCESGTRRRPCRLAWMQDLVGQSVCAGVPVFVKRVNIDGQVSHDPAEWPDNLRRREFPASMKCMEDK